MRTWVGCGKNTSYRLSPSKASLVAAGIAEFAARRDAQSATALDGLADDPVRTRGVRPRGVSRAPHHRFAGRAVRNHVREARAEDDELVRVARSWLSDARERPLARRRLVADDCDTLADPLWLVTQGGYAGGPEVADAALALTRRLLDHAI